MQNTTNRLICQILHRFRKRQVIVFFHESDYIAALMAAEAVKHLLDPAYAEGRGFFIVKRTKSDVISSAFFQLHTLADDIHDIIGRAHLVHNFIRVIHPSSLCRLSAAAGVF